MLSASLLLGPKSIRSISHCKPFKIGHDMVEKKIR